MARYDFGAKEVCRVTGITYQTLDRWIDEGILTCDVPAEGTGSRRRFTFHDVVLAIVARTLKEHNLTLNSMRGILDAIRQNWTDDDPAHAGYLIVKIWREAVQAMYFQKRDRLADFVESMDTSQHTPATWTGVMVLVDVAYLAQSAQDQVTSHSANAKPTPAP